MNEDDRDAASEQRPEKAQSEPRLGKPQSEPCPEKAQSEPRPEKAQSEQRERYPNDVWAVLARWRAERRRFVLLTVVEARGFTPQKPGGRMLLSEQGETAGTIGGGAIEHACLADARAMLVQGDATRMVRRQLTTELGMCCGGEMVVHLEVLEARPRLVVFGAGHVAKPLAVLAHGCDFAVTVVDARSEWLTAERFPEATRLLRAPDAVAREGELGREDYAVVTTHDHALDQLVVQELLPRALRFTGLIGSLAKQRKFALRLRARGFPEAQVARLRTPIGLAIGARTPEEIAVSIVAELVAVRRGAAPERGWLPPERAVAHARTQHARDTESTREEVPVPAPVASAEHQERT
jgi:xanthine dehydrogenase accessory factor